jgi:hypothetical protein
MDGNRTRDGFRRSDLCFTRKSSSGIQRHTWEGFWDPKLIAPSLDVFGQCLRVFRRLAAVRSSPDERDANPPTSEEQAQFLQEIRSMTNRAQEALGFWAVQVEIDLDAFDG